MFCSRCGKSCVTNANFCHGCGSKITGNKEVNIPGSKSGDANSKRASTSTCSSSCATGNGTSTSTPPVTFSQFRARKEDDRNKHFKKKDGKRVKLDSKAETSTEVKINIGIMSIKDEAICVKRGATLPLTVPATITYDELLTKAVEKHHRFNKDIIKNSKKTFYYLLYGDKSKANTLPGCDEPFTLRRYKEEIDKPYTRITLYLCPCSDHLTSIWNDFECFECDSDIDTDTDRASYDAHDHQGMDTLCEVEDSVKTPVLEDSENKDVKPLCSVLIIDEPKPQQPLMAIESVSQCPICFVRFPIQQLEEHADNCSLWLMESEQSADLFENSVSVVEELRGPEPDVSQHKRLLKEQIGKCASGLSSETKRVTVRRKFIWDDFKTARKGKITPLSNLKVVFAGEPSIDDGGPKREFFSGK